MEGHFLPRSASVGLRPCMHARVPGPLFARKQTVAQQRGFSSQSGVCLQGRVPHPTSLKPSIEIMS